MTIDSDNESPMPAQPKKGGSTKKNLKQPQQQIVNADEEDIAFAKDFQIDDFDLFRGDSHGNKGGKHSSGPKFENKTLWSYTNAIKVDFKGGRIDPITGEPVDDQSGGPMTLDERIKNKLEEKGINIQDTGLVGGEDQQ